MKREAFLSERGCVRSISRSGFAGGLVIELGTRSRIRPAAAGPLDTAAARKLVATSCHMTDNSFLPC